jgi:hypothetical protein
MSPATAWVLVAALAVAGLGIVATNFGPLITQVCRDMAWVGHYLGCMDGSCPLVLPTCCQLFKIL